MRGLIGDLLDAGRIDAGTLSISPGPTEVGELVEQARSAFLGGGGRHAVALDLPSGLPPVLADRRRIVQVLGNLFANAARHAPASSPIRVAARARGRPCRGCRVGRGKRGRAGAAAAPVQQIPRRRRGREAGGPRPGARDLQGAGGGARRPHPGREPRPPGSARRSPSRFRRPGRPRPAGRRAAAGRAAARRAGPHPRARRRPADAAPGPRRARRGRLRPAGDRRAAGAGRPSSAPRSRGWCCSTWLCPAPTASS